MKHTTFILAFFTCLTLSAQDTTYVTHNGAGFVVVTRTVSPTGSYTETGRFIGDTSQLVDYTEGVFVRGVSALQQAAAVVLGADRFMVNAVAEDAKFQAAFGRSPITEIQQQTDSTFLMDEWTLTSAEGSAVVPFTRSPQGKLRANVGGANRVVHLVNGTMRIVNFNARGALNFYQTNNATWMDANRQYILRRTVKRWTPYVPPTTE